MIQRQLRAFLDAVSLKYKTEIGLEDVLTSWIIRHSAGMGREHFSSETIWENAMS